MRNVTTVYTPGGHEPEQVNHILGMYKNATILITGGTGFLGKVLLEKALRCLEVKKIFLLVRQKDGLSVEQRLVKLLQDAIFDKVLTSYGSVSQLTTKLEAVQIDLANDRLVQCDSATERRLLEETEIIFNVLASVKFNESIRNAIRTNVAGTRKLLQLAVRMERLRAVVHVSTLYSNCHRTEIEEKIYDDIPINYRTLLELTTSLSEEEMNHFQHCFLGPLPNTYTFSKKCAEVMIRDEFSQLPIGIFRPPIVISTYREPLSGWTDNLNGPSGLCMGAVKGFIHVIWGNKVKKANLVPVDFCVNAIIVAAYDIRQKHSSYGSVKSFNPKPTEQQLTAPGNSSPIKSDGVPLYNYMYSEHSLTWGKYMELSSLGFGSRLHQLVWSYSYMIVSNRPLFRMLSLCLHTLPAVALDAYRKLRRKKPIYRRMVQKTNRALDMMGYFGLREWTVRSGNVRQMRSLLSSDEIRLLEFDMAAIDWKKYFLAYIPGIRRYWCGHQIRNEQAPSNKRFLYMQQLFHRLVWIWICIRVTRVSSEFLLNNLFTILVA
ncbi:fatty acyl-CoA reductase wat-like [Wyeomyia smithii]|uniref:fatty acyl-CoA reductase wat-like n=1 Tax=Wyeomyia smithii TaxID=174621 RepID=UPI0024680DC9|nr:fatty acyl-CoA reductase wat-like [Wyeomyia smithii]